MFMWNVITKKFKELIICIVTNKSVVTYVSLRFYSHVKTIRVSSD